MKGLRIFVLVIVLAAGLLLQAAAPVMADVSTPVTVTLLSGNTTQTAGYTYNDPQYEAVTFVSDATTTETAGFTHNDPSADPLNANSYSYDVTWPAAQVVDSNASPWATIGGANWVSTTSGHSGVETANEGDTWRLFRATFNVPDVNTITAASIQIAADNAYEFYLNGSSNKIASTADFDPSAPVYGLWPGSGSQVPFAQIATYSLPTLQLQTGDNTLMFVVRNWDNNATSNPSGLVYKVTVQYSITENQLDAGVYSGGGSWLPAPSFNKYSTWVLISGAKWVSTTSANYGVEIVNEGDTWRLFKDEFNIPADATDISGSTIEIAGDNAYEVYLNGDRVATTEIFDPSAPVYGPWTGSGSQVPFTSIATYPLSPEKGNNTLMFVVRNWDNSATSNPSGLIYKVTLRYRMPLIMPAQVWYLNSIEHTPIGLPQLEMEKIEGIQTDFSFSGNQWIDDQAAGADVTFPEGVWDLVLNTDADWRNDCEITLNEVDSTGNQVSAFSGTITSRTLLSHNEEFYLLKFRINAASATVVLGNYLAITINTTDGQSHTITTNGSSYLSPPAASPDYPLPEMSGVLLLGLGLSGLIGFVLIRRRRVRTTTIQDT